MRRIWFALPVLILGTTAFGARIGDGADVLAARAKEVLFQIASLDPSWVRIHAADALIAAGESDRVRRIFAPEAVAAESSPYRVGIWRVLAAAANSPEGREPWVEKIERTFQDPTDPESLDAVESLCKLRCSLTRKTIVRARAEAIRASEADALLSWWLLAVAREPEALGHILAALGSRDPLARQRAAYGLRWLNPIDPNSRRALSSAVDQEPADSIAYPYILSAALRVEADPARDSMWQKKLERILFAGSAEARLEVCQALMYRYKLEDLPRLEPLLAERENDTRVGAASVILRVVAANRRRPVW